jgi:hypothetical protein
MQKKLFDPQRLDLPGNLILIPQFMDNDYYQTLKKKAYGCINLLHSDLLIFDGYSMVVNFLGYPHILTLLEFIKEVRSKEIFFLGTAGSLNPAYDHPLPLTVEEIYSTEILDHFAAEHALPLMPLGSGNLNKAKGVTVDIIQRETTTWLRQQVERGLDFVEMELFPLRVYLEKPFKAVVVTSDLLKETGIVVFEDKKLLQKEYVRCYELMSTEAALES